ncbi:hypothetical protein ACFLQJ_01095 [Calditrichota bacterium]
MRHLQIVITLGIILCVIGCSENNRRNNIIPSDSIPVLSLSVSSLDFGEEQNESTILISNIGSGALQWDISPSETWLGCTPDNGITTDDTVEVIVSVDRSDLAVDEYYGKLEITSNAGANQDILVSMTVLVSDLGIVWSESNIELQEDRMIHNPDTYTTPQAGYLKADLDLHSWDGDYGLELMIMTYTEYENFISGTTFSAWHESMSSEGSYSLTTDELAEGEEMKVVIDNSDAGWESTDYDFTSDDATFDVEVVFQTDE